MNFSLSLLLLLATTTYAVSACSVNTDCASSSEFCKLGPQCSTPGTCTPIPDVCPLYCMSPMMEGCDGNSYCNDCIANGVGVSINSTMDMPTMPPMGGWTEASNGTVPDKVFALLDGEVGVNDVLIAVYEQVVAGVKYRFEFASGESVVIYCPPFFDANCTVFSVSNSTDPSSSAPDLPPSMPGPMVGGWSSIPVSEVPSYVLIQVEPYVGNDLLVGAKEQVVAGMNYELDYASGASIIIYCPPKANPNCTVTLFSPIPQTTTHPAGGVPGGWVNVTDSLNPIPDPRLSAALMAQNVMDGDVLQVYEQVVNGVNYEIIANNGASYFFYCPLDRTQPCSLTSSSGNAGHFIEKVPTNDGSRFQSAAILVQFFVVIIGGLVIA